MRSLACLCLLLFAAVAYGDVYDDLAKLNEELGKPVPKKEAPPSPTFKSWDDVTKASVDTGKPVVIFVGVKPRRVRGYAVYTAQSIYGSTGFIGVGVPYRGWFRLIRLSQGSSDEEVANRVALESQNGGEPAASPFASSPYNPSPKDQQPARREVAAADADSHGPWLPQSQQQYIRSLWPAGVPLPDTLRFYKLKTAAQRVAAFGTPGAGNNRMFVSPHQEQENANRDFPWIGSGGMDFAEKGTWRNITGMALPEGKRIPYWIATMPLNNGLGSIQHEWAMHWEFPNGTQMFDVLLRKNSDGSEHIFTVRRRTKLDGGKWDDGASFFPDVAGGETQTEYSDGNHRTKNVLQVERINYRFSLIARLTGKPRFKETAVALQDGGHFFPPGFRGAGLSCNKCHSGAVQESKSYGGPLLRGKDTVFSWYPIPERLVDVAYVPDVDPRWPLERKN